MLLLWAKIANIVKILIAFIPFGLCHRLKQQVSEDSWDGHVFTDSFSASNCRLFIIQGRRKSNQVQYGAQLSPSHLVPDFIY